MTTPNSSAIAKLNISTILIVLLVQSQVSLLSIKFQPFKCNFLWKYTPITNYLSDLLNLSKVQALVISSAESHPSATVKLSPREVDDYHQERAKKLSLAWKNSNGAEGNDFLTELLSVRRLESAIDEAESAYKRVSDAGKLLR